MAYDVETSAELANLAITVWDRKLEEFRYQKSVMVNRVTSKTDKIADVGQTINVNIKGRYTASTVTAATGAFTVQEYTPTQVQLTVDRWVNVSVEVVKKAAKQSFWNPESSLPEEAAQAFGEDYDTQLLSLGGTIPAVGDPQNGGTFDSEMVLAMITRIMKRKIPKDGLSFVVPEEGFWQGIAKQPEYRDADKNGNASITTKGFVMQLYGIPFYTTTLSQKPTNGTSLQALLFHKSAYAIAMQYNNDYEKASAIPAGRLADIAVVHSLYGTLRVRADHAVVGHVKEYVEAA